MKKSILALAVIALASLTASAVSIDWTSAALNFNGTSLKNNTNVQGYLLYLADGMLPATLANPVDMSLIGTLVSSDTDGASKAAKVANKWTFDFGDYDNGDKFALLVSYTDGENTYYNLSSTINTISGIEDERSSPVFSEFTFNNAIADGEGSSVTAGGGWAAAVPEPATGALALAGLALLFRRKRA